MTKMYDFGKIAALQECGLLEKEAFGFRDFFGAARPRLNLGGVAHAAEGAAPAAAEAAGSALARPTGWGSMFRRAPTPTATPAAANTGAKLVTEAGGANALHGPALPEAAPGAFRPADAKASGLYRNIKSLRKGGWGMPIGKGALTGAALGGASGAIGAEDGHRGSGFFRGALMGGAVGAGAGAGLKQVANTRQLGYRLAPGVDAGKAILGAGALGAAGAGYAAGSTAQQTGWERLKSHIPFMG